MIPAQRRRRRTGVALAIGGGLVGVASSHRRGTRAVPGAPRAAGSGRRPLVSLAGLIGAVMLVWGLGGVSTSVAAAAVPSYAWATKAGGTSDDSAYAVSALADGSSIITGIFSGTATFGATNLTSAGAVDTFTAKVNADGTYAWATKAGGTSNDYANGVSALADGSSIITGYFSGTATFGATNLTSAGSEDAFTAKVNADGTYAWATKAGGTSNDSARGVSALADGSSIITGQFAGTATFGTTSPLTSAGSNDTFTARIADAPPAPTSVTGVSGNTQVVVSWSAPADSGGAAILAYTVTASSGGTCSWSIGALSCTVTGLANGTPYTFTVTATNSVGTSSASTASAAVTPATLPDAATSTPGTTPPIIITVPINIINNINNITINITVITPINIQWSNQTLTSPLLAAFAAAPETTYTISATKTTRATKKVRGSCKVKSGKASCKIKLKSKGKWIVAITPKKNGKAAKKVFKVSATKIIKI